MCKLLHMSENTEDRDGVAEMLLEEILKAEALAAAANEKVAGLRDSLKRHLINTNRKKYGLQEGNHLVTATLVKTAPITVDFDRMLADKVLTQHEIDLVTERKFSKKLLEQAVDSGEIGATKIAGYLNRSKETYSVRLQSREVPGDGPEGPGAS